ncbi:C6 zinc finger domain containing protein [Pleurostoma richardsiae]|uniref:C6 zinc finger domain containing protein n=1 Tax=Pleurostoma richardsiae TaxID=41990 RepID=A0AA38RS59_9PEZI|nr:C6 zinc finger domain containing protein [Pleurostoma richardsiae]
MASTRISQRAALSCTECRRRKVRCDRAVPCRQCVKQGSEHSCTVERVSLSTRQTKSRQEISFLRQLQSVLASSPATAQQDALGLVTRRLSVLETGQEPPQSRGEQPEIKGFSDVLNDQVDDAFDTAMTLMRLGRGYPDPTDCGRNGAPEPKLILSAWSGQLPEALRARHLVQYYLDNLNWHHNVIHSPEFLRQCEQYWATGDVVGAQWISLYLSVLGAAAWNFPQALSEPVFGQGNMRSQAALWHEQMVRSLWETEFMAKHSMHSIQAVIISSMVAHPLGHGVRHMVLLNSCLRIAQCLGLAEQRKQPLSAHDAEMSYQTVSEPRFSRRVAEEVTRRIWWQLLVQDYFLVPMAGSYGVNPEHFSTPLPTNCHDSDVIERPLEVPTVSSYCIALAKMARLMPLLIDGLRSPSSTRESQYKHVQYVDSLMRNLVSELPPFLKPGTAEDPRWPSWVPWARTALTISAADKIILIHRSFLIKSFQDPVTYGFTRRTCVSAAMTILNEFHRVKTSDVVNLWIVPTFTVGAAIVIYLDWIYGIKNDTSVDPASLDLLHNTLSALKLLDHDFSSRRGVAMLEGLLVQEAPQDDGELAGITTPDLEGLMAYLAESTVWEH